MKENETTNVDHTEVNVEVCLSILEEVNELKPYSKARATIRDYLKANGDIVIPLEKNKAKLPDKYKVNGKEVKKRSKAIKEIEKPEKEGFELGE